MKGYLIIAFLVTVTLGCNTSTAGQADSIDQFILERMAERRIPGLQIAVVRNGRIVRKGNYGFSNLQDSVPVSDKTIFQINSITKAFTGVAIMQLAEANKISLSAPISAYLSNLPENWKNITVIQLLAHTSGIPEVMDSEEPILIGRGENESWNMLVNMQMNFKTGEKFEYNQTNYLLLGRIIDTLTGISFREFIEKEQLSKAGMVKTRTAGFGAAKQLIANAAGSYRYENGKLVNMYFSMPPALQTAAGMSSTAEEIANWVIALQTGQILKEKSSLTTMWTPAKFNNGSIGGFGGLLNGYAVGWPIVERKTHRAAAAVGGGRSAVLVYPNDDLAIIVLSNLAGASPETFIDEIAGFYIPEMKEANGFGWSASVNQLRIKLERSGYKEVVDEVKKMTAANKEFMLPETELNTWGYNLMRQGRLKETLEIFKLNVFLYPKSANTYDSLGEIYAELGDQTSAIKNYEQSLKLDPENGNAAEQIRRLKAGK